MTGANFSASLAFKVRFNEDFCKGNGEEFMYLGGKVPQLSDAKAKEDIFVGPEIRKLIKYETLEMH